MGTLSLEVVASGSWRAGIRLAFNIIHNTIKEQCFDNMENNHPYYHFLTPVSF